MINEETIRNILSLYNINEGWKGIGKNVYYHCPFHEDKNPSLIVKKSTMEWVCRSIECPVCKGIRLRPFNELIDILEEYNLRK